MREGGAASLSAPAPGSPHKADAAGTQGSNTLPLRGPVRRSTELGVPRAYQPGPSFASTPWPICLGFHPREGE